MPNCPELVEVEVVRTRPNSARINHLNAVQFMLQSRDFHAIRHLRLSAGIFSPLEHKSTSVAFRIRRILFNVSLLSWPGSGASS
jgi:hypothetical protein